MQGMNLDPLLGHCSHYAVGYIYVDFHSLDVGVRMVPKVFLKKSL